MMAKTWYNVLGCSRPPETNTMKAYPTQANKILQLRKPVFRWASAPYGCYSYWRGVMTG